MVSKIKRHAEEPTHLKRCDGHYVMNRGDQSVHTPVAIDLGDGLLQEIGIRRVYDRSHVGGDELSSLRRTLGNRGTGQSRDDVANVESIVELTNVNISAEFCDEYDSLHWKYCRYTGVDRSGIDERWVGSCRCRI